MSERHEGKDKAGMPWAVGEAEDGEPDFVEVASYGLVRRSRAAIGAEILRLAARVRELETSRDDARLRAGMAETSLSHRTTLLQSCEKALEERDAENVALRSERDEAMEIAGAFEEMDPSTPLTDRYDDLVARIAAREGK